MSKKAREILIIIIIIFSFIIASYLSHRYASDLRSAIILQGISGSIIYILIMITAVVVAPFETLPLLPVAVTIWGANLAAVFTIIGWSIGALIAFSLARSFGQRLVCRLASKYDIEEWKKLLPEKNIFWLIVLTRIVLPVDIISYAVGLFTKIHWLPYLSATLLGIIPFAFIFAYGARLPVVFQVVVGLAILPLIIFGYHKIKRQFKLWLKK